MRFASRLDSLDHRLSLSKPPGRVVVIKPVLAWKEDDDWDGDPIRENSKVVQLSVPWRYAENPEAGLSTLQLDRIRPEDRVVIVAYTKRWREGLDGPESRSRGDLWADLRGGYAEDEPLSDPDRREESCP